MQNTSCFNFHGFYEEMILFKRFLLIFFFCLSIFVDLSLAKKKQIMVAFTEEIHNRKIYFLCSAKLSISISSA